jgi:hypothetical protein
MITKLRSYSVEVVFSILGVVVGSFSAYLAIEGASLPGMTLSTLGLTLVLIFSFPPRFILRMKPGAVLQSIGLLMAGVVLAIGLLVVGEVRIDDVLWVVLLCSTVLLVLRFGIVLIEAPNTRRDPPASSR